jgi:hypothetical protein
MAIDIRIRAFRATDDPETCLKYIEGHRKVLSIYGIENITTNTDSWMYNPAIFVVVIESMDGTKLYGGGRLQAADGKTPLPVEEATGKMDNKIHEVVRSYAPNGIGELSGLWNSKEVAGFGIGSIYPSRAILSVTNQVGVNAIITLCAPATVRFGTWIGGTPLALVGNKGTFYYPKLDLIATVLFTEDAVNLPTAVHREREKILHLRDNPVHLSEDKSPFKGEIVNVHYDLIIQSADPREFKLDPDEKWQY